MLFGGGARVLMTDTYPPFRLDQGGLEPRPTPVPAGPPPAPRHDAPGEQPLPPPGREESPR